MFGIFRKEISSEREKADYLEWEFVTKYEEKKDRWLRETNRHEMKIERHTDIHRRQRG